MGAVGIETCDLSRVKALPMSLISITYDLQLLFAQLLHASPAVSSATHFDKSATSWLIEGKILCYWLMHG